MYNTHIFKAWSTLLLCFKQLCCLTESEHVNFVLFTLVFPYLNHTSGALISIQVFAKCFYQVLTFSLPGELKE